jgi:hypothetical protein
MKSIKFILVLLLSSIVINISFAQTSTKISAKDFKKLLGSWKGTLTYLDYSSGKPYTMPADIEVKRIKKTKKFIFSNIYPNEKSANSIDTTIISKDGKYIDKALIKSRRKLENGDIEIITEELGKDGNDDKPATFRHTYTFGYKTFKKRKDVQFIGETNWINRHEYSYKRKPSR